MAKFPQPRELNAMERALLDYLLSADFPGCETLRVHAESVLAFGDCGCGCGTIDFGVVEPGQYGQLVVEAYGTGLEVLLFASDGKLTSLEIVDYGDARPLKYPSPMGLELWVPPKTRPKAESQS
jgi:hypothetical protein